MFLPSYYLDTPPTLFLLCFNRPFYSLLHLESYHLVMYSYACETENQNIFVLTDQITTILQIFVVVTSCKTFSHRQVTSSKEAKTQKEPKLRYIANKTRINQKTEKQKNRKKPKTSRSVYHHHESSVSLLQQASNTELAQYDIRPLVTILKLAP